MGTVGVFSRESVPPKGFELAKEIEKNAARWNLAAKAYGFFYWASLAIVIVLPTMIAAGAAIKESPVAFLGPWIPLFGILVSATAVLKEAIAPGTKWRRQVACASRARDLYLEVHYDLPLNDEQFRRHMEEWKKIEAAAVALIPGDKPPEKDAGTE